MRSESKTCDREIAGLCALVMRPTRLSKSAIVFRPSTIMGLHRALVKRQYRLLFTRGIVGFSVHAGVLNGPTVLRILDVSERLVGTVRRELLDHAALWTSTHLERKLSYLKHYYNRARAHRSLNGKTRIKSQTSAASIDALKWNSYCRGESMALV